jgi:leucyl/phenylalanyl-tRNA---protein transferase
VTAPGGSADRTAFFWLRAQRFADRLPPPHEALREPEGLLAVGGDLAPDTLIGAYRAGCFPWYGPQDPILWWCPDPRAVIHPGQVHVSRSLQRRVRAGTFRVSFDRAFEAVIAGCAGPRRGAAGTWLTARMRSAYRALAGLGYAHSIEVWADDELVGGLYGLALGRVFFGESMFSRRTDASKVALVALCRRLERRGFALLDCQVASEHLRRMGAVDMPRAEFLRWLAVHAGPPDPTGPWHADDDL